MAAARRRPCNSWPTPGTKPLASASVDRPRADRTSGGTCCCGSKVGPFGAERRDRATASVSAFVMWRVREAETAEPRRQPPSRGEQNAKCAKDQQRSCDEDLADTGGERDADH